MKVGIAYFSVVFIWATTPLAIKWSNSSVSFISAITVRVLIALAICFALLAVLRRPLVQKRSDWLAFTAGLVGSFPNGLLVYWAAQHVPSGVAAVLFGTFPFAVGLFSWLMLKENIFTVRRVFAIVLALCGLLVINIEQLRVGGNAMYGVIVLLIATVLFGLSSVWVKRVASGVDPLRQSTGVLLLSTPLFLLTWFFVDGTLPTEWDFRSVAGIAYTAVAGSILGGTLYFYVLKHCNVSTVGVITFITPVMALIAGAVVDNETLAVSTVIGSVIVIVALGVYQNALKVVLNYRRYTGSVRVMD